MNKLKQFFTLAFLLTTIVGYGQTNIQKTEVQPYIEVTGSAEKEVIPDEIYISIVLREKYENRVKVTIDDQEEKLKNAIKSLGIDVKDLSLSDANADLIKVKWRQKDVLAKKDYSLKVSTATSVAQVFQKLDELDITGAHISKVSHSKIDSLRKEIRIMAIRAAKEKADYLLAEIGEQRGQALVVTESLGSHVRTSSEVMRLPQRNVNAISGGYASTQEVPETEIQFEKIKLNASVFVKFAIK